MENNKKNLMNIAIILCVIIGSLIITHSILGAVNIHGNLPWMIINAIFFVGALLNGLYALIKIVLVVKDDINNNVALFVTSLVAACVSGLYAIWWSIDFLSNFIGLLQGNL